jgi:DNA polymerase-3 subunit epsilon
MRSRIASMSRFVAIDFETADFGPESACAIAVVAIEDGRIAEVRTHLIRPPYERNRFSGLHGLTWDDLADAPDFAALWPDLRDMFDGAEAIVAHNAGFDRAVLRACCHGAGHAAPDMPYICTMRLARALWRVRPTSLRDVCRFLAIAHTRPHDAEADARACAAIAIAALEDGRGLEPGRLPAHEEVRRRKRRRINSDATAYQPSA